jgi:hypothetical protein
MYNTVCQVFLLDFNYLIHGDGAEHPKGEEEDMGSSSHSRRSKEKIGNPHPALSLRQRERAG